MCKLTIFCILFLFLLGIFLMSDNYINIYCYSLELMLISDKKKKKKNIH